MRFIRKFKKNIVAFFILNILFGVILPNFSLALTSGPVSPEFSSFEPVNASDLVNYATGDLAYNLPLIEIPGPEGGYPLSLSYHSGIRPEQEASWVGLGWTLNPGAINRFVNAFPDDYKGVQYATTNYWSGGKTSTFSVGAGYAGANASLTVATDTYRGNSTGFSVGYGVRLGGGLGIGGSIGKSIYGGLTGGLSVSAGTPGEGIGLSTSLGIGFSRSGDETSWGVNQGVSMSYGHKNKNKRASSYSLLGANMSMNSGGGDISTSGLGISMNNNQVTSANVTTKSNSWGIVIPIWTTGAYVTLGGSSHRYHLLATDHQQVFGALYTDHERNSTTNHSTFDSNPIASYEDANFGTDPNRELGGSIASFDSYSISGQGIGGALTPYYTDIHPLYRRNVTLDDKSIEFTESYNNNKQPKVQFRLANDVSNHLSYDIDISNKSVQGIVDQDNKVMIGEVTNMANLNNQITTEFNHGDRRLTGSHHVEWFSNAEIANGNAESKGFVKYRLLHSQDFNVANGGISLTNQIGGFMVTNASGVTYHYGLPVYAYNEYSKSTDPNHKFEGKEDYVETIQSHPYAYTWLLTAITGPDYVDRDGSAKGILDESDWGYWVKFDYGKWTDKFLWRTPNEGDMRDPMNLSSNRTKSFGFKEIYYLDAIETRTHTALFVKSLRKDGKSVSDFQNGGFEVLQGAYDNTVYDSDGDGVSYHVPKVPIGQLKLDKILLYDKQSIYDVLSNNFDSFDLFYDNIKDAGDELNNEFAAYNGGMVPFHFADNVLDIYDLKDKGEAFSNAALRQIVFDNNHYDLCPNTPNSFDLDYENFTKTSSNKGKLTLDGVTFLGRGGKQVIPSTKFGYHNNNPSYSDIKIDKWGMYAPDVIDKNTSPLIVANDRKDNRIAGELTSITTPLGAVIGIGYESDQIDEVVFGNKMRHWAIKDVKQKVNPSDDRVEITILSEENLSELKSDGGEFDYGETLAFSLVYRVDKDCNYNKEWGKVDYTGEIISSEENRQNGEITLSLKCKELWDLIEDKTYIDIQESCEQQLQGRFDFDVVMGVLSADRVHPIAGGNLRVAVVAVGDGDVMHRTKVSYGEGVVAYEPVRFPFVHLNKYDTDKNDDELEKILELQNSYYNQFKDVIVHGTMLPSPHVVYDKVTITDEVIQIVNGASKFDVSGALVMEFNTADENSFTYAPEYSTSTDGYAVKKVNFKKNFGPIGTLLKSTRYAGQYENTGFVSSQENIFYHDKINGDVPLTTDVGEMLEDVDYNELGHFEQLYYETRIIDGAEKQMVLTNIENIPDFIIGDWSKDVKTGIEQSSAVVGFDYLNGQATASLSKDMYDNYYLSKSIPAYRIPEYSEMGPKTVSSNNKNMLSQKAASYIYKVDPTISSSYEPSSYIGVVSGSANIWSKDVPVFDHRLVEGQQKTDVNTGKVWYSKSNFGWISDEPVDVEGVAGLNNFMEFDFGIPNNNSSDWQKLNEVMAVNTFSGVLEERDMEGNFSASLFDPFGRFSIANANFASSNEIAYSGGETVYTSVYKEGNVSRGESIVVLDPLLAHTGSYCLKTDPGMEGFKTSIKPETEDKKYMASVWVYLPGSAQSEPEKVKLVARDKSTKVVLSEIDIDPNLKSNNKYLIRLPFTFKNNVGVTFDNTSEIEIVCINEASRSVYFDDFRVHPFNAGFVSYVYDKQGASLTHILDNYNFYTRFEYDAEGRLKRSIREKIQDPVTGQSEFLISEKLYNYKRND